MLNRNLRLAGPLKRLDSGDKVKTHTKSAAEMALKETCILAVKERSLFEVPQTLGQEAITQLKAQQGTLLFKVISGSNFEVKTADVIAGVKGTLFELDIIDSFHTLLETPALEIGVLTAGGTMVNVYEGEVELKHNHTGATKTLKAGEGIAVLSELSLKLNKALQNGFGEIIKFVPSQLLTQNYSKAMTPLLDINSNIKEITNFPGIGLFNSSAGDKKTRLKNLFTGFQGNGIKIDNMDLDSYIDILSDEKYTADFSRFRPRTSVFSVAGNKFNEVYIGHKAFAACKPFAGSRSIRLDPTAEGISLVEGNGIFRILRFKKDRPDIEFIASHYTSQNTPVTTVQVIRGELYGRIPGEIEYFKIPAHAASLVIDPKTKKASWMQADPNSIPPDSRAYVFQAAEKIAKEKEAVKRKNTKKKINGVKKLLNKRFGF
jgi:hypothetical protein